MAALPLMANACQRCAMPLDSAQICGRCLSSPPSQDYSFSLYRYQDTIRRCITAFKFHQQIQFAHFFADQMAARLLARATLPDCLVAIPLHPARLRQRGFNQSLEVTKRLASQLNLDYSHDLLQRVINTRRQSELHFRDRKRNMRRAFQCPAETVPSHIAIIDDVMTSGHTSSEASRVLRQKGAKIIEVWTIARAISHY
jgi:ComF family protein